MVFLSGIQAGKGWILCGVEAGKGCVWVVFKQVKGVFGWCSSR